MNDDSPISRFLKERGEGIHHIAITADEIEGDVNRAMENGMKFLGGLRTGSYGRKITFIHPKSLNGVLVEFCQAPPGMNDVNHFYFKSVLGKLINQST